MSICNIPKQIRSTSLIKKQRHRHISTRSNRTRKPAINPKTTRKVIKTRLKVNEHTRIKPRRSNKLMAANRSLKEFHEKPASLSKVHSIRFSLSLNISRESPLPSAKSPCNTRCPGNNATKSNILEYVV